MGANLGRITVDLLAKSDQFEAGLAKAAGATAQFGQTVTRRSDQWSAAFTRTNAQWENYLKTDDKIDKVNDLSRALRQLGQIIGPGFGGGLFRLAGNLDRVSAATRTIAGLGGRLQDSKASRWLEGGAGAATGAGAAKVGLATTGAVALAGAAGYVGGTAIDRGTGGALGSDVYGRRRRLSDMIGRAFSIETQIAEKGTRFQERYERALRTTNDTVWQSVAAWNTRNRLMAEEKLALQAATEEWAKYHNARSGKIWEALGNSSASKSDALASALAELGNVTDTENKWDKLTRKIGQARLAIDALLQSGQADPYVLGKARDQLDAYSEKLSEMQAAEEAAQARGMSGASKQVDSLSRMSRGSPTAERQTSLLGEINAGIKALNTKMGRPALVGG